MCVRKRHRKFKLFFVVLIGCLIYVNTTIGNTYYISNAGNDKNLGTSAAYPWKTISKLNFELPKMHSGDVILFKCGDYFVGEVILPATIISAIENPIFLGSYGGGNKPILVGGILVSGWPKYNTGNFKTRVGAHGAETYIFESKTHSLSSGASSSVNYRIFATSGIDIRSSVDSYKMTSIKDSSLISMSKSDTITSRLLKNRNIDSQINNMSGSNENSLGSKDFLGGGLILENKNEFRKSKLLAYPNPVNETLIVEIDKPGIFNKTIEILDITGTVIFRTKSLNGYASLNMLPYRNGLYFVRVGTDSKKIVVKH
jgi:hypothetical protein